VSRRQVERVGYGNAEDVAGILAVASRKVIAEWYYLGFCARLRVMSSSSADTVA